MIVGTLSSISRREFLKLSSAGLLALLAARLDTGIYAHADRTNNDILNLGRITANKVDMFQSPKLDSKLVRTLWKDLVLPITGVEFSNGKPGENRVWYRLDDKGYVHSRSVQPVKIEVNDPQRDIPAKGILAEVTVPYTDAVWNQKYKKMVAYRLYYSTTHWITDLVEDEEGNPWYEILEDFYQYKIYANPAHLRPIPPEEVTPLSPDIPPADKRIEVRLRDQIVIAYEGSAPVQMMRCSSGTAYTNGYLTPTGQFTTHYKRPSRHMVNSRLASAYSFDLPGVPWICYMTEEGVAFHGTYWHNDFGQPRSHGCINLLPENAKWLYRWTTPHVPYEEQYIDQRGGTRVDITL
jgi:lipoprotein-anchoring transpeptidase ErfK/SrfK